MPQNGAGYGRMCPLLVPLKDLRSPHNTGFQGPEPHRFAANTSREP